MKTIKQDRGVVNKPSAYASMPRPTAVYAFPDKVQLWSRQPLCKRDLARLRKHCGSLHYSNQPARFNPSFRQRLQLYQPRSGALQILTGRNDVHLNYVEVALDWIFDDEFDRDPAFAFLDRHHVKNYHREQGIRYIKGVKGVTRYTGPRRAPTVFAAYADRECKLTGEVNCLHAEWRMHSHAALKRAGISTVTDLINLDYREFWRQRLLLCALDLCDLGRRHYNYVNGTKRRRNWSSMHGQFRYDHDKATGAAVFNYFGSTQKVLDRFGPKVKVRGCLIPLDAEHLLPSKSGETP